jgi:hypothetical protein
VSEPGTQRVADLLVRMSVRSGPALEHPAGKLNIEFRATAQIKEKQGESMAQNHYVSKSKRRPKSKKRGDSTEATMAKLRSLAAEEAKKSAK